MQIEPYLFFDGRCEEAVEFYKSALGAKVEMLMRVKDAPTPPPPGTLPPGSDNKVMHCSLDIGGARVMCSDGHASGNAVFKGFSLSLARPDAKQAKQTFDAIARGGGTVNMPLGETFWSPCFGMITDKFGVQWMITVPELKMGPK